MTSPTSSLPGQQRRRWYTFSDPMFVTSPGRRRLTTLQSTPAATLPGWQTAATQPARQERVGPSAQLYDPSKRADAVLVASNAYHEYARRPGRAYGQGFDDIRSHSGPPRGAIGMAVVVGPPWANLRLRNRFLSWQRPVAQYDHSIAQEASRSDRSHRRLPPPQRTQPDTSAAL